MVTLTRDISDMQREWRNHPDIMRWCRQHLPISEYQQEIWREKIENDSTIEMFGILADTHVNVGTCGLTSINMVHRTAEWSLFISPDYQGHGFATDALRKLLLYGFSCLDLHVIWGEIFEHNKASLKIAHHVGMTREGMLIGRYFKEGRRINTIMVSMTQNDYVCKYGL